MERLKIWNAYLVLALAFLLTVSCGTSNNNPSSTPQNDEKANILNYLSLEDVSVSKRLTKAALLKKNDKYAYFITGTIHSDAETRVYGLRVKVTFLSNTGAQLKDLYFDVHFPSDEGPNELGGFNKSNSGYYFEEMLEETTADDNIDSFKAEIISAN